MYHKHVSTFRHWIAKILQNITQRFKIALCFYNPRKKVTTYTIYIQHVVCVYNIFLDDCVSFFVVVSTCHTHLSCLTVCVVLDVFILFILFGWIFECLISSKSTFTGIWTVAIGQEMYTRVFAVYYAFPRYFNILGFIS